MNWLRSLPQGQPKDLHAKLVVDASQADAIPESALRSLVDKQLDHKLSEHHPHWPSLGVTVDQVWYEPMFDSIVFLRRVIPGGQEIR